MADAEYARFESMTNAELRTELKQRGCPISGNKKDLLAKLRAAIDKQYEESEENHLVASSQKEIPITHTNLPIQDQVNPQYSSVCNVPIPESTDPAVSIAQEIPISISVEQEQISSTPERKTRARSKKPSVDSRTNEITHSTSVNNEAIPLDPSTNVEVNSCVSKSNEEREETTVDKIGEETLLPSIGSSSSPKLESVLKEIPSFDEQQRLNQSESNDTTDIATNEKKDESAPSVQPEIVKQQETTNENEKSEKPQLQPSRSQTFSLSKISNRTSTNKINLIPELLQTFIPDLSLLSESMANDELDSDENNESAFETSIVNDSFQSDSMTIGELADQKQQSNRTVAIDDPFGRNKPARILSFESKTILDGKGTGIMTDEPIRIKDPTVTHEPPSDILYIRGLTRPFSLMQLKGLLSRYGRLVDGEFWLDKIKSQCFAMYHTFDEAQNARESLDGCRWPSTNPKTLSIRFARSKEFEYSKTHDLPPDHMSTDPANRIVEELTSPANETEGTDNSEELKLQREKQSGFLITDEDDGRVEEAVKTNDQPMKGLDDYFRKTKAKPSIYWLPLTDEQIIHRIHRQEQRNAERDEEQRKREIDGHTQRSNKRKRSSSPAKKD